VVSVFWLLFVGLCYLCILYKYVYYMCIIVSVQSIADSIRSVFVIKGMYIFVVSVLVSAVNDLVPVKVLVFYSTLSKKGRA
jgi:hypothetical protein